MGPVERCCALLCVLCLCCRWGLRGQDLREQDAVCQEEGCFAVYLQRRTFLDSWRSCKDRGGNLATIKRPEEAALIRDLFFGVDPRGQGARLRVWIGLQRQPRQCSPTRPLRGFTWITGDQDTQYTNWLREDQATTCSAPRCVVMMYGGSAHDQHDNFKWLDGSCALPVDGFLCRYNYKGMCPGILDEGGGPPLYTTPFNLMSTLLAYVPFGSVATVPCPEGTKGDQTVLCMLREDGSVGWSKDAPLCSDAPQNWCDRDNGGCEHFCLNTDGHYYCECSEGFVLAQDGQSCWLADACRGAPCEFECHPAADGYRCACPQGYLLAPDGRDCVDVDECLQEPCPYECVNAPGTFQCLCGEGYEIAEDDGDGDGDGDGVSECEDVDECLDEPCEHACENMPGSYACHCHLGYAPAPDDPTSCQDTDECQIPGTCQQMCVNHVGGFECHCEEGYELQIDHFSCSPVLDDEDAPTASPSFLGVSSFLGLPWGDQGPQYAWELPDWMTEPPDLEWFPTGLDWFTGAPGEEPVPTPHPDWIPDNPVHDWADPDWIERAKPALTPAPGTTPAPDWIEDETTPTPIPDWIEDETTPTPIPDWFEDETTPTPIPDWFEDETTPTPIPDWMEKETTPTPAPNRVAEVTTSTSLPDWPVEKTTPAPGWPEAETTPTPTPHRFDVEQKTSRSSPSVSPGGGAVWERLRPSPTLAAPVDSVGLGSTVSEGLGPDRAPEYEYGVERGDSLLDSRASAVDVLDPASGATGQEARVPAPEWYTAAPPPLTPLSPFTPIPGAEGEPERDSRQRQDRSWLVVALLVPLCIFVVVMVALGIVYCTRCAVQPRSKSVTDCYRWVTSSKPATGAASGSATPGTKSRV
ncbi:endosialin-like [Anguilla anguilla]|uniref:endosialin-like n=1 Tax=Anguilla anguilla TaxID=7936 RepID=UPI0015AFE23C|nr:endosialin-like [Anguilla anguilla]